MHIWIVYKMLQILLLHVIIFRKALSALWNYIKIESINHTNVAGILTARRKENAKAIDRKTYLAVSTSFTLRYLQIYNLHLHLDRNHERNTCREQREEFSQRSVDHFVFVNKARSI